MCCQKLHAGSWICRQTKRLFFFSCHSCYSPLNLHSSTFFLFCLYAISSLTLFSHLWAVHIGWRLIYLCLFYTSLVLQILVFPIWPPFLGKVKMHAIAAISSLWSVGHSSEDWLVERDLGWTPGITEPTATNKHKIDTWSGEPKIITASPKMLFRTL